MEEMKSGEKENDNEKENGNKEGNDNTNIVYKTADGG